MAERNGYKANIETKRYKADIDFRRTIAKIRATEAGALRITEDGKIRTVE